MIVFALIKRDTTPVTPPICVPLWLSSPRGWIGSDATNRRPPWPGHPISPHTTAAFPEINTAIAHLRDVLGEQTYESLARKAEMMTTAEIVTYAYDQIDQARTELNAVSKGHI
jgi:hypothetical protein